MTDSSTYNHFFDLNYPFDSDKNPWDIVDNYKEIEDDILGHYLREVREIPDDMTVDDCSIENHCGIRGGLLTLLKKLSPQAGNWQMLPETLGPLIAYDVLHKNGFRISPMIRLTWGTLMQKERFESKELPVVIISSLSDSTFVPDVGSLLAIVYGKQIKDTSIYLIGECDGAFGNGGDVSVLNRDGWGVWTMAVAPNKTFRFKNVPAGIKQAICTNVKDGFIHLDSPLIHEKVLPLFRTALCGDRGVNGDYPNTRVISPVSFYRGGYSIRGINMTSILWEPKNNLLEHINLLVILCLPVPHLTELSPYKVDLSFTDFRVMQRREFSAIYDNCLDRFLEFIGIDPVTLIYSEELVEKIDVSLIRHVLTSMFLFLAPRDTLRSEEIFDVIQRNLLSNTNRELLRIQIKKNIQVYDSTEYTLDVYPGVITTPTSFLTTLSRVMPNFTQYALSYFQDDETTESILISQCMILILLFKIVPMLKWKPFFYLGDVTLEYNTTDIGARSLGDALEALSPTVQSILPVNVDTESTGRRRVLLVFFPKSRIIEYYDEYYSTEALEAIKRELYHTIKIRDYRFVKMIQSSKYRNAKCFSFLPYFITFATQNSTDHCLSDRIAEINTNADSNRAKEMYLSLYTSAYTWIEKYSASIKKTISKNFHEIIEK
jgi:hypothetical protein